MVITPESIKKLDLDAPASVLPSKNPSEDRAYFSGTVYQVATWLLSIPLHHYEKYFISVVNYPTYLDVQEFLNMAAEPSVAKVEAVDHPSHYNTGKIEVIEFIEDQELNFSLGSVVKYVCRAGKKNKTTATEDLKKAIKYLEFEIARLERQ